MKWQAEKLGNVVEFLDHKRKPVKASERTEGIYPYYGANGQQGTIDDFIFDEPLILAAEDGGHFGIKDRPIAYRVNGKCWVNNHAHVLRPRKNIDIEYLFRQLQFFDVTPFITGTTRGKLTKNAAARIPIVLPPLLEQRRIATILDKADSLRRKRAETLKLLDQFLRSVFLDMFGDPVKNEKGWEMLPMTKIFNIRTGKLDSNAAVENGKYPFFTCSRENFKIDTYAFDCETLLLSGNNAAGDYSVKHYKGKFNAYQRTYVLELKDPQNTYPFFKQLLEYKLSEMKQGSRGTNTKYLTISFFERLDLFVPSQDIQMQFERISAAIHANTKRNNDTQEEMNNLFNSLAQRAFQGEL